MKAMVARAFLHRNTGRIWREGETFTGDRYTVEQLVARGCLRAIDDGMAGDGTPDLAAMTVAELRALAAKRGVDVPSRARKADVIAALSAAGE